jgi:hypothetical protein
MTSTCLSLKDGDSKKIDPDQIGLYIPLASIVTTLGGIALIATHLGNICHFRRCRDCELHT